VIDWLRRTLRPGAGMELILHLGAHRTGSTAFERMLEGADLAGQRAALWGNARVRGIPGFEQGTGADSFAAQWQAQAAQGTARLVICDENILGTMLGNLMAAALYPDLPAQLARYARLFPTPPRRIGLGIREPASYWTSCWSFVARRRWVPGVAETASRIAAHPRGWADVVADLRAAFPRAEILVWPHEGLDKRLPATAARLLDLPEALFTAPATRINAAHAPGYLPAILRLRAADAQMTEAAMRAALERETPEPGYSPFTPDQRAALAARHARDLTLLRQGHAGATLLEEPLP
jgi:hypothetical protein